MLHLPFRYDIFIVAYFLIFFNTFICIIWKTVL